MRAPRQAPRRGKVGGNLVRQGFDVGKRDHDAEQAAASGLGFDDQGMAEHAGDPFDDRQPQSHALPGPRIGFVQAVEFLEDLVQLVRRDPDAGVPHADQKARLVAAAADQDPTTRRGIADRIAQIVPHDPAQQVRVAAHRLRTGQDAQVQRLSSRKDTGFLGQMGEQVGEAEIRNLDRLHARIQLRDVEQGGQHLVDRIKGDQHAVRQMAVFRRQPPLGQRRGEDPRRVQRLQQVVADGRQETGFRPVGLFGVDARGLLRRLRRFQILQGVEQRRRALAHLVFQPDGGLEQREGVALIVHAALDPAHQGAIDLAQLGVLAFQARQFLVPGVGFAGHGASRAPMATPVRVWLTCMAWYCSP